MTHPKATSDLAYRVADLLKVEAPWDVVGERATRYELHLQGTEVELERGPILVEGYGLRLFRPRGEGLGTGFQASTDLSPEGLRAAVHDAEATARNAEFPAKTVDLPSSSGRLSDVPVVDPKLWSDPAEAIRTYVAALLRPFEGRKGVVPSFGSVKATLSELSLANSAGLRASYASTSVELELGVKAFGGPEGAPPGEFWVTRSARRLEPETAARDAETWCRYATDVRRAVQPPTGDQAVVLTPEVLSGIIPQVLGFRFTGAARLRKLAPEVGARVGAEHLTVRDEGDYPWAPGSAPLDDEGSPHAKRSLLDRGAVGDLLYDALYGSAFSTRSTGNGIRSRVGPTAHLRFAHPAGPGASTLVVPAGDGGTVDELIEAAGDGILVTQLGWAIPNPISGAFGGEVRIGYRIRGGKLAEPVRGGTVGGTVLAPPGSPSMLTQTEAVGRQAEIADRLVTPPVLVRTLSVAGGST